MPVDDATQPELEIDMSIEDDEAPIGGGKAIEQTWDRLRPGDATDDSPTEGEHDIEDLDADLALDDEVEGPLDGEVMDDPVDTSDPMQRFPGEDDRGPALSAWRYAV